MYGTRTKAVYRQSNRGVIKRFISEDGVNEIQEWKYSAISGTVTVTAPDGSRTERDVTNSDNPYFGFENPTAGISNEVRSYGTDGRLLSRTLTERITKRPPRGSVGAAKRDARVSKTVSIIFEDGQTNALATLSTTEYDETGSSDPGHFSHLNPKRSKSYHYKALSLTQAKTADIATIVALFNDKTDLAAVAETDYSYDSAYMARGITSLVTETRILDRTNLSNVLGKTQIRYDESAYPILSSGTTTGWENPNSNLRGNPTTNRTWVKESNTWIETHAQYDNFGNPRKAWDAKGNVTEIQYAPVNKFAYPTKTISAVPDPSGVHGSSSTFEVTSVYDFTTGLLLSSTDANGNTSTTEYKDPLLRPTAVVAPNGARTEMTYGDNSDNIFVKTRSQFDTNVWAESTAFADNFGRGIKTEEKDINGNVFTEIEYDNMNRVKRATNPYRSGDTKLWSLTTYDEEGRVEETFSPAPNGQTGDSLGSTEYGFSTVANYVGIYMVEIDASGRKKRSITNALGQLIRVDEATSFGGTTTADLGSVSSPKQTTYYKYDAFNNLLTVNQGVQTRTFTYDSLSRLKTASNPESGTMNYTYDANGNLLTKIDARSITTTYTYDQLNRVKTRSYSDGTPAVTYTYDNYPNAKGLLTKISSSVSETEYTSFDKLGRVLAHKQTTDGSVYNTSYIYNLFGELVEQTYPSGRKVKNTFDSVGRLSKVETKTLSGAFETRADNFSYLAHGAVSSVRLGNNRYESMG